MYVVPLIVDCDVIDDGCCGDDAHAATSATATNATIRFLIGSSNVLMLRKQQTHDANGVLPLADARL